MSAGTFYHALHGINLVSKPRVARTGHCILGVPSKRFLHFYKSATLVKSQGNTVECWRGLVNILKIELRSEASIEP